MYLQTSFPVAQDDRVLIPPGTYVDGIIDSVQRPGRVKGRGELRMHFTKLTFPNGYTVLLPGSAESVPGAEKWRVTDKEGTIQADPQRGQDAGTVAGTAATGAAIGGIGYGGKGAGIGAGAGGGVGLATVLLTHGNEVHLDTGTAVVMVSAPCDTGTVADHWPVI